MTTREFFIQRFRAERPKFLSVIRAMPAENLDYRPHERNSSARMIAWFLVLELRALVDLLKTGENRWQQPPAPDTVDAIATDYDKAADEMERLLASSNDERWESEGRMLVGDKVVMKRPVGQILWDFFFDAIHHRGQLTAYLRPMGGKVPAIYGPSADAR